MTTSRIQKDTIFARASGAGKAGVAVFRLSGPDALSIAQKLISKQIIMRVPVLARLIDPTTRAVIDQGLVLAFEAPASFTGEHVAEFQLHGSRAVETALYDCLAREGARPAEAGEFTLRALRNGKLDLAQAEALADLIDAETSLQRQQALGQLDGRLSEVASEWRTRLLAIMAPLEADIDFPDEGDVPAAVAEKAGPAIVKLKNELTTFLDQSNRARTIREGVSIAIIGAPNAGKSSLLNALAGSDVAIVSETPGTTRDIVEARLDLGGIVATLADTAGIRIQTNDPIEREGMARAVKRGEAADIRIAVLDPEGELSAASFELLRAGDFLVWSKSDLGAALPGVSQDLGLPGGVTVLSLSAKTGAGVELLVAGLTERVSQDADAADAALTRIRHVKAVEDALEALTRAETRLINAPELAAEDTRLAARALGGITGDVGVEEVLGEIFSSFCIGK